MKGDARSIDYLDTGIARSDCGVEVGPGQEYFFAVRDRQIAIALPAASREAQAYIDQLTKIGFPMGEAAEASN